MPTTFRILGPLDISVDGTSISLGGRRQQTILAMLLLTANHVVAIDRMIDAVWGEDPPNTARSQILIIISALRRRLGDEVIITRPPGYLIRVEPDQLDADMFARLAETGRIAAGQQRPADAVAAYRQAIPLWLGPALAGIASAPVRAGAIRLTEQYWSAYEHCIELELALGRHAEIIGELSELVALYPLRERLRAKQMLALSRAGRQADALEAYRSARSASVEELGLDPGEELREIERAILSGEREASTPLATLPEEPAPPTVVPHMLPAPVGDFTGRADLLDDLTATLSSDRTADEPRRVEIAAVCGPGGIGKSALAVQAAHGLRDEFPDGQLYAELRGHTAAPAHPGAVLDSFLVALGVPPAALPRSLADKASSYRSRLAERRMLVILDDAADESQVTPLVPGSETCAVLVTSRRRMTGLPGAHHVELGALPIADGVSLLARVIGEDRVGGEAAAAQEMVRLCDGLPLALRIVGARLAARRHLRIEHYARVLRDEDQRLDLLVHGRLAVRDSMAGTYETLVPAARRLFRRLAALPMPDVPYWVGAVLLDTDLADGEDLLGDLVEAQLIEVVTGDARQTPRFRMAKLVRLFARERLQDEEAPDGIRATAARALAGWLALAEEAHGLICGPDYARLHGRGHGHSRGPHRGHGRGRPERVRGLADVTNRVRAQPLYWVGTEARALQSAVREAARLDLDDLCWRLAVTSVTPPTASQAAGPWRETHELAQATARQAGNRRGEAAVLVSQGTLLDWTGLPEQARRSFHRAAELFDEIGETRGRTLARQYLRRLDRARPRTR